jgi:hypothetical protein
MSILSRVKALMVGKPAPEPMMRRWSPEDLAANKAYLEGKSPDTFTLDDHMLTCEYLVQRYLPPDTQITQSAWLRRREGMMAQVRVNLARASAGGPGAGEMDNAERAHRRELLQGSYAVSFEEFQQVIVQRCREYPFGDALDVLDGDDVQELWRAARKLHHNASAGDRAAVRDAQERLAGKTHPILWETSAALVANCEFLKAARAAGHTEVQVSTRPSCRCLASLDKGRLNVDQALAAFEGKQAGAPLLPPIGTECGRSESPFICSVLLTEVEPPMAGRDAEFQLYLDELLKAPPA